MFSKSFLAVALMCSVGLLSGCDSMMKKDDMKHDNMSMKKDGMSSATPSANPKDNIIMVTAHGGTASFAYDSATSRAKVLSMNMPADAKECAACMDNVNGYFSTGKIASECPKCGAKFMVMGPKAPKGTHDGM